MKFSLHRFSGLMICYGPDGALDGNLDFFGANT
jgi:hypothetical protein